MDLRSLRSDLRTAYELSTGDGIDKELVDAVIDLAFEVGQLQVYVEGLKQKLRELEGVSDEDVL